MLCDEMNSEQLFAFTRELFASIREINRRLDELRWVYNLPVSTEEVKKEVRERYKRLQETKFCFIYSIYDIRTQFTRIIGEDKYQEVLGTIKLYEELRDL